MSKRPAPCDEELCGRLSKLAVVGRVGTMSVNSNTCNDNNSGSSSSSSSDLNIMDISSSSSSSFNTTNNDNNDNNNNNMNDLSNLSNNNNNNSYNLNNNNISISISACFNNNNNINNNNAVPGSVVKKNTTVLHGNFGGCYEFKEGELVPNGNGGFRGVVRMGCVLASSSRYGSAVVGERVAIKELLGDQHSKLVYIPPQIPSEVLACLATAERNDADADDPSVSQQQQTEPPSLPPPSSSSSSSSHATTNIEIIEPNLVDNPNTSPECARMKLVRYKQLSSSPSYSSCSASQPPKIIAVVESAEEKGVFRPAPLALLMEAFGLNPDSSSSTSSSSPSSSSYIPDAYLDFLARKEILWNEVVTMLQVPVHPNLVHLMDAAVLLEGNVLRLFVVMPFVECGDLLDYVSNKKPCADSAKSLLLQIVSGLQALHQAGLAHRDVKCDNIFVDRDGTLKLGDFGLSGSTKAILHERIGSPHIAAPEILEHGTEPNILMIRGPQFRGYNGAAADVWSLGIVLFQCIVHSDFWCYIGQTNRIARMMVAMSTDLGYAQLCRKTARLPDRIPKDAGDLILKLLDPNPVTRIALDQIRNHVWLKRI